MVAFPHIPFSFQSFQSLYYESSRERFTPPYILLWMLPFCPDSIGRERQEWKGNPKRKDKKVIKNKMLGTTIKEIKKRIDKKVIKGNLTERENKKQRRAREKKRKRNEGERTRDELEEKRQGTKWERKRNKAFIQPGFIPTRHANNFTQTSCSSQFL